MRQGGSVSQVWNAMALYQDLVRPCRIGTARGMADCL
jgi:hypothetical protein